jgi:hypothetical protein
VQSFALMVVELVVGEVGGLVFLFDDILEEGFQ